MSNKTTATSKEAMAERYWPLHDTLRRAGHTFGGSSYRVLCQNAAHVFRSESTILLTYSPGSEHMELRAASGDGVDINALPEGAWLKVDADALIKGCQRAICDCPVDGCVLWPFCMLAMDETTLGQPNACHRVTLYRGDMPMAVLICRGKQVADDGDEELEESYTALMRIMLDRLVTPEEFRGDEELYRNLIEATRTGYLVADLQGTILDANDEYARMTGFGAAEEIVGRSIADRTAEMDRDAHVLALLSCAKDRVVRHLKVSFAKPDGMMTFAEVNAGRVCIAGQECILALCQDVTERQRLENQLAQAQKLEAIGQLAAGIAHEINTPTQYVGDNIRFLQAAFADIRLVLKDLTALLATAADHEASRPLVESIRQQVEQADLTFLLEEVPLAAEQSLEGVQRVARIVRAMKEFSHPGTESMSSVNINETLRSTITVCRNEWKYSAEMKLDLAPDLPVVPCLEGELNQVFLNLIINAAHAIEDAGRGEDTIKGRITVSTRLAGDIVEIRIADTGCGIPPELQSRVFEPFFTTKDVGRGTGQGLAIARSIIVEKHNGEIDFETQPGKGTTFIIKLPTSHTDESCSKETDR